MPLSLCSVAASRRASASPTGGAVGPVHPAGMHLIRRALLAGLLLAGSASTPALAAQQASRGGPTILAGAVAPWDSSPMIHVADVDSTVPPCHDFHRYATNDWYRRTPDAYMDSAGDRLDADLDRITEALREFVVTAPALAATTADPPTRLVGQFYGSCLADTSGTAAGAMGDNTRARYCFRMTLDLLESALFTVLLERVWPAPARAQSRALWTNMVAAAAERFRTSKALSDNTRQRLLAKVNELDLKMSTGRNIPDIFVLPFLDSIAAGWDGVPAARRGYGDLVLSPTDFRQNLVRLRSAAAPVLAPSLRETLRHFLAMLSAPTAKQNITKQGHVFIAPSKLIPPRVDGTVDLGAWYGVVAPLLGHEMGHWFDFFLRRDKEREVVAFAEEQLKGQLELRAGNRNPTFESHPFDDHFGALLAHDAFARALQAPGQQAHQPFEGFTPEQRFFLGVAHLTRGGPVGSTTANGTTRARVWANGALSAMPAFAKAFGCKAGAPMAGEHVWYRDPWRGVALTRDQSQALFHGYWLDALFWRTALSVPGSMGGPYTAPPKALVDSLAADSAASHVPGFHRLARLAARQLGEYRAGLPPAGRAQLDPFLRYWVRDRALAGFPDVTIPGLQP